MCFKHLYKKILSLALILALTIPANAAISVSDGSAFVSKSEFSTDITNLSNRMAQLENSLDGKIDSLVSSYLSRNGIWNGEAQGTKSVKIITDSECPVGSQYYFETPKNLFQATKSGLLFVSYNHPVTSNWRPYTSNYGDGSNTVYLFPFSMYCAFLTRKTSTSSVRIFNDWSAALTSSLMNYPSWAGQSGIVGCGYGVGTISFFVEKGDYVATQVGWVIGNAYFLNRIISPYKDYSMSIVCTVY